MEKERVIMLESTPIISIASIMAAMVIVSWVWKMVKKLWLDPKRLERVLKGQGLKANPYRFWIGDLKEIVNMHDETSLKPMKSLSDDLCPRLFSFVLHMFHKYGKNSFLWHGPTPRLILTRPDLFKEVFNKPYEITKGPLGKLSKYVAPGIVKYEGDKWAKHRKILSPALNLDKLKAMSESFFQSGNDMIREWEKILLSSNNGTTCEIDVWHWLSNMTQDVISRAAFGSSFEEGKQIFLLLNSQSQLVSKHLLRSHIPFWRFMSGKDIRKMKEIDRMVNDIVKGIIKKKEEGEAVKNNILGTLLESNRKEVTDNNNKNNKVNVGISMIEVIEECKFFYFGGQGTTASLLAWTMLLLSMHSDWQARAREEVFQVFGDQKPNFDGLGRLKTMTMILYEVLRLYPPVIWIDRMTVKEMKIGELLIPEGVHILIPILLLHHDEEIWGSDVKEFKPERFSEGISKAGKGNSTPAFLPFGWGARHCIGQNFTLSEAKMALSLILQNFWFELSPSYFHAPVFRMTLQPQHGLHLILHKLNK